MPKDELEEDLLSLIPVYNKGATRQIKEKEVYSAIKMYNSKAMLTQRERLEDWQGWEFKPIKRNGRKQATHLKIARFTLETMNEEQEKALQGRPKGSSQQKKQVEEWRTAHPEGTPKGCIAETGISKNTVYRWWK